MIEERFEGDDYRLMIVANKFQTGFDQPLLAGMFLDKPVVDRNAVQTVSRLNRCHEGKKDVVVVDFTNNAKAILKAFVKYRKGTPFEPEEPDQGALPQIATPRFWRRGCSRRRMPPILRSWLATGTDAQVQFFVNALRTRFQAKLTDPEERKAFVYLLARFVKSFPLPDVLLHLCAGDQGVRHVRRIRRPAAHQGRQRVRPDEADSADGSHQGRRRISGRRERRWNGETQTGQRARKALARRRRKFPFRT